jgi:transposase
VVQKRKKARKPRDNEPRMDLRAELKRICGVDLTSIDGVNVMTAFTVISEVGTDMSRFEDEDHFASWMRLASSKDISSGKVVGRGKKKVKNRVAVSCARPPRRCWRAIRTSEPVIVIYAGSYPRSRPRSRLWHAISQCLAIVKK